jgi:squalene-hopene/tetraprenyl-beta-curcumene cyclase
MLETLVDCANLKSEIPNLKSDIRTAYATARDLLLAERVGGHWVGELSTSALSTATAVSALSLVARLNLPEGPQLDQLISGGVQYLVEHQNPDGGWGDTDKSYSNIATSYLAVAAFHLAQRAGEFEPLLTRAESYLDAKGRIAGLRERYGVDKTFVVPILTNCALAGLVPWDEVSPLPFELACVPQSWYRFMSMPVVSYAIPALVAIGQAKYFHAPPWNPVSRTIRRASVLRSLKVLRNMQPLSGGYLEAIPLTSFVAMSLASILVRKDDPRLTPSVQSAMQGVLDAAVIFLFDSVRPNGSWPIDTNLATWVTTLALNALSAGNEDITKLADLDWLLACQHNERHPFTGAEPGGWGWSDLSGAVPDADDTPGALLALSQFARTPEIDDALLRGATWLIALQNRDGGWPTFCRGWGRLPFDRSGTDLTAHAIRALTARANTVGCVEVAGGDRNTPQSASSRESGPKGGALRSLRSLHAPYGKAIERGFRFLERNQRPDGSWLPLWFGNQDHPAEENPIYGTARVLLAYRDTGRIETLPAQRGLKYLVGAQNADGGWGGGASVRALGRKIVLPGEAECPVESTVEETAVAVEALLGAISFPSEGSSPPRLSSVVPEATLARGLAWLCHAVENGWLFEPAPIGFYFAKLWYYERLYPLTFTVAALGRALRLPPQS